MYEDHARTPQACRSRPAKSCCVSKRHLVSKHKEDLLRFGVCGKFLYLCRKFHHVSWDFGFHSFESCYYYNETSFQKRLVYVFWLKTSAHVSCTVINCIKILFLIPLIFTSVSKKRDDNSFNSHFSYNEVYNYDYYECLLCL